jgi:outer membrane immunogenic protein
MKKLLLPGLAFAALIAGPAMAADLRAPVYKRPVVALYNWTGFYVGLNAGYAAGHDTPARTLTAPNCVPRRVTICPNVVSLVSSSAQSMNPTGFSGGLQIGYNYQYGNILLGIESDINSFRLNRSNNFGPAQVAPLPFVLTTQDSATTNWLLTVRPRIGYFTNNFLAYITGGLAVTDETYSSTITMVTDKGTIGTFATSASQNVGWALGGGLEYAFAPSWSVKAEYLHVDFGNLNGATLNGTPSIGVNGMTGASLAYSNRLNADIVRIGINYNFGHYSALVVTK